MTAGQALLAALPIAGILALMVGARWPAWRAGLAGLAVTLVIAVGAFGFGRSQPAGLGLAEAAGGVLAEAGFTTLTILWIIVPALAIHQLQLATGATDVLRLAMGRLSRDPGITALLVAWFFVLFMEGAAGFGASVRPGRTVPRECRVPSGGRGHDRPDRARGRGVVRRGRHAGHPADGGHRTRWRGARTRDGRVSRPARLAAARDRDGDRGPLWVAVVCALLGGLFALGWS